MLKQIGEHLKYFFLDLLNILAPIFILVGIVGVIWLGFLINSIRTRESGPDLSRAGLLYDFNYLMTVLEENFPSFGVIYRRNGVDLLVVADEIRERITDEHNEMDVVDFWVMLREDFFRHAHPVGHLRMVDYFERRDMGRLTRYLPAFANSTPLEKHRHLHGSSYYLWSPWPHGPFLDFHIIEEGRIAYLGINGITIWPFSGEYRRALDEFYASLYGFEHLIIDMRGSRGGHLSFFTQYITSPLVSELMTTNIYSFYLAGSYNMEFMRRNIIRGSRFEIELVNDLFPYSDLPYYFLTDLAKMDYYFVDTPRIFAASEHARSPFEGTIWMLTGRHMYSAAQSFATLVDGTGFAILVGETTGGMAVSHRVSSNFLALPNTGIVVRFDHTLITDNQGRPLELGTKPHYFNRPSMDALGTALAIISERE